ncbi:class I SAM-dependent methyltransferase [Silvimonas iriomotensis]|uniref:Methyltransferase type 11 domain-containing protein n=1 Tax=Silvimonas iriomotensis TaxID=449662 RepID=A0ABQ2P5Z6_9NEIS|nr:class I SAM-dependent methyltransferase [Silvimonas iriomotensis]GGP18584.1 hypothetical protein GCM10010970_05790 [Silvimonas iriomotensis]
MSTDRFQSFRNLGFEDFRQMAQRDDLSPNEKIGFPKEYRDGFTTAIMEDIQRKLPALDMAGATIVDVGSGCGDLALALIGIAEAKTQRLVMVDSEEVLKQLPASAVIERSAGLFPESHTQWLAANAGRCDAVLCYSVFQYVYADGNIYRFLDAMLGLLAPGGSLLIGDLPNHSMLQRFLASEAGARYHRQYTGRDEDPAPVFNQLVSGKLDDSVISSVLQRARSAGFHAWVVPQAVNLPMANRREDILITRP